MQWEQPSENLKESLVQAMNRFDGVEFDLRLSSDGIPIIHHDRKLAISEELRGDLPKIVEENSADDLRELGFPTLSDMLAEKNFLNPRCDDFKFVCLELKVPHPKSKNGGSWLNSNVRFEHMEKLMENTISLLDEHEIPSSNGVFYSFYKPMNKLREKVGKKWKTSTLRPIVPPFGGRNIQRIIAFPEFLLNPVSKLIRKQEKSGSPLLPCALEYLINPSNRYPFGKYVSLEGKGLERLQRIRQGFPMMVFPGPIELENKLLEAGISVLTDAANPEIMTLPTEEPRWKRPASQPLNEEWGKKFKKSNKCEHAELIKMAERELPLWSELSKSERIKYLKKWGTKFQWKTINHNDILPLEAVRLLGHRGCGKTERPIFS